MDLRLVRNELGQDTAETQRVLAERGSHEVVTGGRRVALVEDQIDDPEHRRQPDAELFGAGDLEWDVRLGQRALCPDDALSDGRLRNQKSARDLLRGEAAEQAERQRNPRFDREHRMAGDEHQAQEVVADLDRRSRLPDLDRPSLARPPPRDRALRAFVRAACSRRKKLIAWCLAVAMSQAPGLSGTPDSGHCSSAATRASCASSSATPTSRTMRARPAISLGDSIRKTAWIARCVSETVTRAGLAGSSGTGSPRRVWAAIGFRRFARLRSRLVSVHDLANFVLAVARYLQKAPGGFNRLLSASLPERSPNPRSALSTR